MKAYRKDPDKPFEPVTLELESQDEVNAIYAVLNHSSLCRAIGIPTNSYRDLIPYRTQAYESRHKAILKLFSGDK